MSVRPSVHQTAWFWSTCICSCCYCHSLPRWASSQQSSPTHTTRTQAQGAPAASIPSPRDSIPLFFFLAATLASVEYDAVDTSHFHTQSHSHNRDPAYLFRTRLPIIPFHLFCPGTPLLFGKLCAPLYLCVSSGLAWPDRTAPQLTSEPCGRSTPSTDQRPIPLCLPRGPSHLDDDHLPPPASRPQTADHRVAAPRLSDALRAAALAKTRAAASNTSLLDSIANQIRASPLDSPDIFPTCRCSPLRSRPSWAS